MSWTGFSVTKRKIYFALSAATGLAAISVPAAAKSPPAVLIQSAYQPVCQDRPSFGIGNYTPSLTGQDLTCWLRKIRIKKLPETPLAPGVDYVAPPGEAGQRDELGFLPSEWLKLSDAEILAVFLRPKNINYLLARLNEGSVKALVPYFLLGQFVTESEAQLAPAFGMAYPACAGFDPSKPASDACTIAYREIRTRIANAGFGQQIIHGNLRYYWSDLGSAIGKSHYAKGLPRVQWLRFYRGQVYDREGASMLLDIADAGFGPAAILVARLANSCSGSNDVLASMNYRGLSLKTVADRSLAAGDSEGALLFGQFLRNGTCGAQADRRMSFDYLYKSAELGNPKAVEELALLYNNDEHFGRDPRPLIATLQSKSGISTGYIADLQAAASRFDKVAAREGLISDNPSTAPNLATVRAVMLRELRAAYESFDGGLQNELSQMFGNRYNWDESKGRLEMFQNGNSGMIARSTQQFNLSSATCTAIAGRTSAYRCRSTVSVFMDASFGNMKIADNISTPPVQVVNELVFEGGKWRSPALRQQMIAGLKTPPASGRQASQGQSSLCRSLNAGVAAAGGTSTSRALSPSTWGC